MMRELVSYLSALHDDLEHAKSRTLRRLSIECEIERVVALICEQWGKE